MTVMKRLAAVAAATVLPLLGTGSAMASTGAATASSVSIAPKDSLICTFNASGVNIRQGPDTSYASNGQGQYGQKFSWNGTVVWTNHLPWFQGYDMNTGVNGWVVSTYLYC